MSNILKKIIFSFAFSLMMVFLPLSVIQIQPVSCIETESCIEQQFDYFNFYSICKAETENNKKSVSKFKKQKKEAPFIVKFFGLFVGFGTLSYILHRNRINLDRMELDASLYKEACYLGFLCFFVSYIVHALIVNIFFTSSIFMAGFSEFFTYGSYLIIFIVFLSMRLFCFLGFLIGYFLPIYLLEIFFG